MHEEAAVWRGADLAFVDAAVTRLARMYFQSPVLKRVRRRRPSVFNWMFTEEGLLNGPEALVGRIRVSSHRQQMQIPVPDPRNLTTLNNIVTMQSA